HHNRATVVTATLVAGAQPSARADSAALKVCAVEGERREVRAWNVLQTDLRRPILIHEDALVVIAEAVVAERRVVEQVRRDRPVVSQPHHPARRVLQLVNARRQSRRGTPSPSGRVVAQAVGVVVVARNLVVVVEMMINLDAVNALVKDRAAGADRGVVVEHPVNDRVGDADLIDDVAADRTPQRRWNNVAWERVAHHGVADLARRAWIVKLTKDDRASQRVSPDLLARIRVAREGRVKQLREITALERRHRQPDKGGRREVPHARDFQTVEEEGAGAPVVDLRDLDRPAEGVTVVVQLEGRARSDLLTGSVSAERLVAEAVGAQRIVLDVTVA